MLEHVFGKSLHDAGKVTGYVSSVLSFLIMMILAIAVGATMHLIDHVTISLLVFAVLLYHSSILLIIGIIKNRHLMLIPWMINGCILMVMFLYVTYLSFSYFSEPTKKAGLIRSVLATLITSLFGYVFYGIISLFFHIKDIATKEKRKNRGNDNDDHQIDAYPNYVKL